MRQNEKRKTVFRIAGFTHPYLIVRLDVLESMLRKGVCGIRLKELNMASR